VAYGSEALAEKQCLGKLAFMATRWHLSIKLIVDLTAKMICSKIHFVFNCIHKCHLVAIKTSLPTPFFRKSCAPVAYKPFLNNDWISFFCMRFFILFLNNDFILVEGEMDRLRILTADLGTIPSIADYGHIKTEPISCHTPQIITIKQELPTTAQFFVKSEIHDSPQYTTPDEQKVGFRNKNFRKSSKKKQKFFRNSYLLISTF